MTNYTVCVTRAGRVELTIEGVKHTLAPSDVAHIAQCVLRGLAFQSKRA